LKGKRKKIMDKFLRKATINDIAKMRSLENECFFGSIKENFEFVLTNDNYLYLVCENNNSIVAYAGASISYEQGDILSVCVKKDYRNKGYALSLLNCLIKEVKDRGVKSLFLEVEEDNLPAISLYKKIGFAQINIRKNYYGTKSAIIMLKEIS